MVEVMHNQRKFRSDKPWLTLLPSSALMATLLINALNSHSVFANPQDTWGDGVRTEESWADDDWSDENWSEEPNSLWQFTGFGEVARGQLLQSNIVDKRQSLNEIRARLDAEYHHEQFQLNAVGDAYYDQVLEELIWQTRELNVQFNPLANLDVKVGRQVMTWGTGDYVFLNDLFSKDWQSFFSGRENEFLKAPSDAVRLTYYFENSAWLSKLGALGTTVLANSSLDFTYLPDFTPDKFITGERFSFYSVPSQSQVAAADAFALSQTTNGTYAIKFSKSVNSAELALYGYKGYWNNPYGINEFGEAYFPELNSVGASIRLPLGNGIFNAEYAKYNSIEDSDGTDNKIANDQSRFLIGYEQELVKNLTLGTQFYLEKTEDYSAYRRAFQQNEGFIGLADKYRQMATIRITHRAFQQKLTTSLFVFYSPTDADGYIKPSINYRYSDTLSLTAGANVFFGEEEFTFWGQHQPNTNAWIRVRMNF